jgi:voltage-gated potassium channel
MKNHFQHVKNVATTLVATIIFFNGILTILLALAPDFLSKTSDLGRASKLVDYAYYRQVSLIFTVIIGLILLNLGLGLYRKYRNAWRFSVLLLLLLLVGDLYPKIKWISLGLCFFSLAVLLIYHKQFTAVKIHSNRHTVIAWISILIAISYGWLGCYLLRTQFSGIHTPTDALYYTIVTYSTVGFGDIVPITSDAKLFVMTMIMIGLGSFATVISVLIGPILQDKLKRISEMVAHMNHLKNHAVLLGFNTMTLELARVYQANNIEVLFVVNDQQKVFYLEQLKYHAIIGDLSDETILNHMSLSHAQCCVCACGDDAKNIVLTMKIAGYLLPIKASHRVKIISIIDDISNEAIAKQSGADQVIIPAKLVGQALFLS